ncbi:MAG TPA: CocE/NonD family hydrolase [Myxococcota bacterium]|nr:CocE/NonD family hydrolase [Myxococcota bacterium]
MISRILAASMLVATLMVAGCGDGSSQTDEGGTPDAVTPDNGNDVVPDVANPDEGTPADAADDTPLVDAQPDSITPPCPPHKCIDDGNGNMIENPNPGCVGELCVAGPEAAPDPMSFGPFPVGIRQFVYYDPNPDNNNEDGSPRKLKIDVWFPTTEEFRGGDPFIYDVKEECGPDVLEKYEGVEIGRFPVDAVLDAPVRHGDGRFPVVIFSHGAFGIRFQSIFFTIQLASHGYIVISADHQFNTLNEILVDGYEASELLYSAQHRPKDIFALLDWIEAKGEDTADEFYDLVDMENVACTGHSFGGLTSYIVTVDPRIDCIIPMSPAADMVNAFTIYFNNTPIEELSIPTLMMAGEQDKTLQYQPQQRDPFDTQPAPKWLLSLPRAGHYTFTDSCMMNLEELQAYWEDADDAIRDGCGPDNFDWREAHKVINLYGISFLNHFLRHSPAAGAVLVPESAQQWGEEVEFIPYTE